MIGQRFGMAFVLAVIAALAWSTPPARASVAGTVQGIVRDATSRYHVRALLVEVREDGRAVYSGASGLSMTNVPATTSMHFRNGAMAFSYMSTLLMVLVDRHRLALDDKLAKFLPSLPHASEITLRDLANMTSGYADYVYQPEILNGIVEDPFQQWTSEELMHIGLSKPMQFAPGTNFGYSHTNYVILGEVLAKVTGMPLDAALSRYVFGPMHLQQTQAFDTPFIPEPVLHVFSSERREALKVPKGVRFYEESTYWNPSWTTATGAVETTTIDDFARSIESVGSGALLSRASHEAQIAPRLIGFGHKQESCSACMANTAAGNYALGVVRKGAWVTQTKNFAGSGATAGYLPTRRLTVAVAVTYAPEAFDDEGNYKNSSSAIFEALAKALGGTQSFQ